MDDDNDSKDLTLIALVLDELEDDEESSTDTPINAIVKSTSVSKQDNMLPSAVQLEQDQMDQQLVSLLSLRSFSFWNGNNGNKESADKSYDGTYATDDESYGVNSLESWMEEDERDRNIRSRARGHRNQRERGLLACGENMHEASDVIVESLLDTTRAISMAIKRGTEVKTKVTEKFVRTKEELTENFYRTKEERERTRMEKLKLEEERSLQEREWQLREEMRTARAEVGAVANLWRENSRS